MAAGATGTPTSLGIPKYNTSVDSPSGVGFNSAMDAIDTLIAARATVSGSIAQTLADAKGDIIAASAADTWGKLTVGANGTVLTADSAQSLGVKWAAPAGATVGTSLPGSPADGDECIIVDSTSVPTYAWRFKYMSTPAKWLFIGGVPGFSFVAAAETTTSGVYAVLGTAGPSFTVPLAGDYIVEIGSRLSNSTTNQTYYHGYDIGGTGAVDGDAIIVGNEAAAEVMHHTLSQKKTGLSASTALVSKYKTSGGTLTAGKRWMRVTPVQVT